MVKSSKNNNLSKSSLLLKQILDLSNVGQRECSENMGRHEQFLRNYLYSDKEIKFGRNFAFDFLASIYHEISIKRGEVKTNEKFQKILNDETNIKYEIVKLLLLPALERHILALAKIEKQIYEQSQEIFFDSYIQQIFPTETEEYMKFLREMDYPRDGYKNIDDLKQIFLNTDEDNLKNRKFEIKSSEILKFKNFESRAESINNFYFVCEKLRENYLPSFISLSDWKEIEMPYFNKGSFLIKKSKINNLKKSDISGGQVIIKSGRFEFDPNFSKSQDTKKKRWFFGREYPAEKPVNENTQKLAIENEEKLKREDLIKVMKHELSASHSAINEANKLLDETRLLNEKQSKIINKFTIENIRLQKEINYYKEITLYKNNSENKDKELALKKLIEKGKKINLADIDNFINKYGQSKDLENYLKTSLDLFTERNIKIDNKTYKKKRA